MKNNQSGQVLLIIVLVMVVGLTVGLSLASRSIVSLRTSEEEIASQQALSAAEAGIEQVARTNTSIANGTFLDKNNTSVTYNTSITSVEGNAFLVNGGNSILKDDGADVWLSSYSTDPAKLYQNQWSGSLNVYWGKDNNACNGAALEIVVISGSKAVPIIHKYAFDPCLTRANTNHFTSVSAGATVMDKNFPFGASISVSGGFIARIVPLYQETPVGITTAASDPALPSQGSIITSVGSAGSTSRKVTVFQGYPTLPSEYFPYGIFSP